MGLHMFVHEHLFGPGGVSPRGEDCKVRADLLGLHHLDGADPRTRGGRSHDPWHAGIGSGLLVRSRILVRRIWRGTPAIVAEVWTREATDCDRRPFPGSHFVALTKREAGRDVAEYTECSCGLQAFATAGPGRLTVGGVTMIGLLIGLGAIASVWLSKIFRRRAS